MTNEEMIQDLKQFIVATVSQQTTQLEQRLETEIKGVKAQIEGVRGEIEGVKADVAQLDQKLDTIQDAIAETLTHAVESVDTREQVRDHEQRLQRLEHRAA